MAFEWVAGLFQADNQATRGLSGDSSHSVALDDSNPYYNYRLRRHRTESDLVAEPGLLWYTSPYVKRRAGLGTHVAAEVGDGTANYTDVLIILSREDFRRAGPEWQVSATRALQQEFDNFCRREGFSRLHAHRPLGVRFLEDGAPEIGGQQLGLAAGEFISGLLPNLYTGPVRGSYPVIGVHVNLPGVWEGYQEVGRLHNDQILFTIGNHWLDNFSHPSLHQAALYRLRQYPDGSFVHIVNPDLQDQYQVTSTNQGGASVLTLATRAGQPLAYMVLAVIDPPTARPSRTPLQAPERPLEDPGPGAGPAPRPSPTPASAARRPPSGTPGSLPRRPDIQMPEPPVARPATPERPGRRGTPGVPSIAPPMLLDEPPGPADVVADASGEGEAHQTKTKVGGRTIIPDTPSERIFTLQERGALLQKVHFSQFMLGYDVYLGARGELGTHVEDPAATFQVRKRAVSLVAHVEGVMVGGRPVSAGVEVPIDGDVRIDIAGQQLEYRDLRGLKVDGWPYVGEIRRPASSTYMIWGEDYQVGRSRECRVVLPDEPRNDNIHWKPSVGDGATIRARTGEIPKSRFYTDSIMVASEHATIDLRDGAPRVLCHARHCYVYIRRNGHVLSLYPATSAQEPKLAELEPGDEVLIGNCLFHVGFTPADEGVEPAPAPRVDFRSDSLADVIDDPHIPTLDDLPEDLPPHAEPPSGPVLTFARDPEDAPSRLDPIPPPSPSQPVGPDSLVFDQAEFAQNIDDAGAAGEDPRALGGDARRYDLGEEDEPTAPGMVMPRDTAAWDAAGTWDASSQHLPEDDTDLSAEADVHQADVGGWDSEDWSDEDSAPRTQRPLTSGDGAESPNLVPTPFPEVQGSPLPAVERDVEYERTDDAQTASRARPRVVRHVDDAEAQFELGRPLHLVLQGWMVNGEVVCGNHQAADLIVPENRMAPQQSFDPVDYFRLRLRGRRGTLSVLASHELLVDGQLPEAPEYSDPDAHTVEVIRRDENGEEDFTVVLQVVSDTALPDPRARLVSVDTSDPLTAALFTWGLPRGQQRVVDIDGIRLTLHYDREVVTVADYLDTYWVGGAFRPFFVQRSGRRFTTAPEDGASFELSPGDRLIVGHAVYLLREV